MDGEFERFREWVEGEPEHPLSWADLGDKFADLALPIGSEHCEEIVVMVRSIESVTAAELIRQFRVTSKA